jgi:ParB family chromosome partitioning protein
MKGMPMKSLTVELGQLLPAKENPRRSYDQKSIEGLAQTIAKDGLLQNLTARPEKANKYRVVFGMRRYLALQHLVKEGTIERSYKVLIQIKKGSANDIARMATVENVQREPLDPIDEAEAFARLLQNGTKIEDLSVETGVSVPTIRRRLALADLSAEVKRAVRDKALALSVAEVLTLVGPKEQKGWLKQVRRNGGYDASYLRSMLLREKPSVAIALFPLEKYTGSLTKDLFADKETTYFDDREQFLRLQGEAVEALAVEHRKSFAWVDMVTESTVQWWQYRPAKKGERAGVVIHFPPTGKVEIRKGLARYKVDPMASLPSGPRKPKEPPEWSKATLRYANAQRSVALRAALLGRVRLAREAAAILLLTTRSAGAGIRLQPHESLRELAKDPGSSKAYEAIEAKSRELGGALGLSAPATGEPAWETLLYSGASWADLLAGIRALSNDQLDVLILLAVLACLGTISLEAIREEGTLFAHLAQVLSLDLRTVWTPDFSFLKGLRRRQLVEIAEQVGATRWRSSLVKAGQGELALDLAEYFKLSADGGIKDNALRTKAEAWLPACMQSPPSEKSGEGTTVS